MMRSMMWLSSCAGRRASVSLLVLVAAGTAGCGESTAPNGTAPGINVIAGANVTDTVDAVLPQPRDTALVDDELRYFSTSCVEGVI